MAVHPSATLIMADRAARLRGLTRLHNPTIEEPLIVVIIDELASVTAYNPDRKTRVEAEQLIALLLTQGRAVGVAVIGALQDPSKEVMGYRQLFPTRIGLRLTESTQVAMALDTGARDAGAACDTIPVATPGVGYVGTDGSNEYARVRAYHVTDANITTLTSADNAAPADPNSHDAGKKDAP